MLVGDASCLLLSEVIVTSPRLNLGSKPERIELGCTFP